MGRAFAVIIATVIAVAVLVPAPAAASLVTSFSAGVLVDENTSNPQTSDYDTQAGGHPDVAYTKFTIDTSQGTPEYARVDLPAGLSVNPQAVPKCEASGTTLNTCASDTQVGVATVTVAKIPLLGKQTVSGNVYNMVPSAGEPSDFAFQVTVAGLITVRTDLVGGVRWYPSNGQAGDYAEYFAISGINNALGTALETSELKFWGAPEEHNGGGAANNAFLTNPTTCAGPQTTYLYVSTYAPTVSQSTSSTTPVGANGCAAVPFKPTVSVTPATTQREAPDGVTVDVHVPQDQNPAHIATSHLKEASVTLPAGMSIDPSAANGLQACKDSQLGAGTNAKVACPAASEVGSVEISTPVLPTPLTGAIYVGEPQEGNPYRIFLDAENANAGVAVRLIGSVSADAKTGQLTATFLGNPQLPFTDLKLAFKTGAGALLANPRACGVASTAAVFTPYSGTAAAAPTSSFTIDNNGSGGACPGPLPFAPNVAATPTSTTAGAHTNLNVSVTRADGELTLGALTVKLPEGMLANLGAVTLCGEAAASAGTCTTASQIGTVTVSAGTGATPLSLSGTAYLTGPYGGQPFGLSVVVPAIAGPYNLGTVIVRAAVAVDTVHGQVTIKTDALPTIVQGVPLRLRKVAIAVNAASFLVNPTSCSPTAITGSVGASVEGTAATQPFSSPVTISGCESLPFAPRIAVTPSSTQRDSAIGLGLSLTLPAGSSDLQSAVVRLPSGLSLNPAVATGLQACTDVELHVGSNSAVSCPAASAIGSVEIHTPLLPSPLTGSLYVGQPLSTNPESSQEYRVFLDAENATYGISVRLIGTLTADAGTGLLTATFASTPPVPFTQLQLNLTGGPHSPLASAPGCGEAIFQTTLTPTSGASASPTSSYAIDDNGTGGACPASAPFNLSQSTQDSPSSGAANAAFTLHLARSDGQQYLSQVKTALPPGLLGRISAVSLCSQAQAAAGTCPSASQIGQATVGVGAGSSPLELTGNVYLTGPYESAPYGLAIVVPAENVGPFDFGVIVTRAKIEIDERTARASVASDSLPTIVGGVPLRLQTLAIIVGSSFIVNPTSCAAEATETTLTSTSGATQSLASGFQATGCGALSFSPTLTATTSGHPSKQNGASLQVQIAYPHEGQANVAAVSTTLPAQLPARLTTLQKACPEATFAANPSSCPTPASVGRASVSSPLLPVIMSGPAYLVSHAGAAFPNLDIVLTGNGLRILLLGQTHISSAGVITTTFPSLPDVPISRFTLELPQGPYSALGANGPLCGETLQMPTTLVAQNGARVTSQSTIAVAGCAQAAGAATAGTLSRLRISPSRFTAASSGASIAAVPRARGRGRRARATTGATVSYVDASAAATSTFAVLRPLAGQVRGHACVAPARSRRSSRTRSGGRGTHACVRLVRVGSFTHRDRVGANSFHFSGRIGRHKLAPGAYRLQVVAVSAGGLRSAPLSAPFAIRRG